jgi:hypothetical protein
MQTRIYSDEGLHLNDVEYDDQAQQPDVLIVGSRYFLRDQRNESQYRETAPARAQIIAPMSRPGAEARDKEEAPRVEDEAKAEEPTLPPPSEGLKTGRP